MNVSAAEDRIRDLLDSYERALNISDPDLAASWYTSDGIFMPTTLSGCSSFGTASRRRRPNLGWPLAIG